MVTSFLILKRREFDTHTDDLPVRQRKVEVRAASLTRIAFRTMPYFKLLVLGALLISLAGCAKSNTRYANPDVERNIKTVKVGDPIQGVLQKLGTPLFADVNPAKFGDGAYRQVREHNPKPDRLIALLDDRNVELYLYYSQPKNPSGHYLLYSVWITNRGVTRVLAGEHQD